jgi:hypothetical protein
MHIMTALNDAETAFSTATIVNDAATALHITREEAIARSRNTVLAKREQFAKEYAIMKAHLNAVGIEAFSREQQKIDKMFKALGVVRNEFAGLTAHVDALQHYFDHCSPRTIEDMQQFIAYYVAGASRSHPRTAHRLHAMHTRITQLHSLPETLLDTLGRRGGSLSE